MPALPFQSAPNCIEIVIHGGLHGKSVANVLNVNGSSPATPTQVADVADIVDGWMGANWLPDVSDQYEYNVTTARGLDAAAAPFAISDANAGPGGRTETTPVSNQVSFAIKLQTPLTGRSHRGRFYVAGLTDGDFDTANILNAGRATAWRNSLRTLNTALTGAGFPLAVISRFTGGARRTTAAVFVVTSIDYVDLRVDTLRRRLPKA